MDRRYDGSRSCWLYSTLGNARIQSIDFPRQVLTPINENWRSHLELRLLTTHVIAQSSSSHDPSRRSPNLACRCRQLNSDDRITLDLAAYEEGYSSCPSNLARLSYYVVLDCHPWLEYLHAQPSLDGAQMLSSCYKTSQRDEHVVPIDEAPQATKNAACVGNVAEKKACAAITTSLGAICRPRGSLTCRNA
nr:hypothetical protein CFP56_36348 [Quercus suber]